MPSKQHRDQTTGECVWGGGESRHAQHSSLPHSPSRESFPAVYQISVRLKILRNPRTGEKQQVNTPGPARMSSCRPGGRWWRNAVPQCASRGAACWLCTPQRQGSLPPLPARDGSLDRWMYGGRGIGDRGFRVYTGPARACRCHSSLLSPLTQQNAPGGPHAKKDQFAIACQL